MTRARASSLHPSPAAVLLAVTLAACGDGNGPTRVEITSYSATGSATGTDPETGESLQCAFLTGIFDLGGPLTGSWTGSTRLLVVRSREAPSLRVTYDTVIADQEVTLTALEGGEVRFATAGAFTDTLVATLDTAFPGYGIGDWTCGPSHPLARVQEGAVLPGQWRLNPEALFE